jgi:hypothetical protein
MQTMASKETDMGKTIGQEFKDIMQSARWCAFGGV